MKIKIFIILMLLFFSTGCFDKRKASMPYCEEVKNNLKRDKCFANLVEEASLNNTQLGIEICNKIFDKELKGMCFFKVAKEGWRNMSFVDLDTLCVNIRSEPLKKSCLEIHARPHLQFIK